MPLSRRGARRARAPARFSHRPSVGTASCLLSTAGPTTPAVPRPIAAHYLGDVVTLSKIGDRAPCTPRATPSSHFSSFGFVNDRSFSPLATTTGSFPRADPPPFSHPRDATRPLPELLVDLFFRPAGLPTSSPLFLSCVVQLYEIGPPARGPCSPQDASVSQCLRVPWQGRLPGGAASPPVSFGQTLFDPVDCP